MKSITLHTLDSFDSAQKLPLEVYIQNIAAIRPANTNLGYNTVVFTSGCDPFHVIETFEEVKAAIKTGGY